MRTILRSAPLVVLTLCSALASGQSIESLDLGGGVALEIVRIPKGTFRQGSPESEAGRQVDETQRDVTITHDFFLGRYPVTVGQFERFVGETNFRTESEKGTSGGYGLEGGKLVQKKEYTWRHPGFPQTRQHPVVLVTYADALAFCQWLDRKTHRSVRLPTEAEWEYACRAGSTTRFSSGDSDASAEGIVWHKGNSAGGTQPVDQKQPNAFGLFDMSGNAYEWCSDWFGPYPAGPATDPLETRSNLGDQPRRSLRGGSFLKDLKSARSASRYRNSPGSRNADNGFRIACAMKQAVAAPPSAQPVIPASPPVAKVEPPPTNEATPLADPHATPKGEMLPMHEVEPDRVMEIPLVGLLIMGGAAVILVVVFLNLRRFFMGGGDADEFDRSGSFQRTASSLSSRSRSYNDDLSSIVTRLAADGFWISTVDLAEGTVVNYRYRANHQDRSGSATVDAGNSEQFIYTGDSPNDVEILQLSAPDIEPPRSMSPRPPSRSQLRPIPRSSPPTHRYPSAY